MGKRFFVIALLVCFTFFASQVYAEHGKMKGGHGNMEGKFYKKAMLMIANQEELGLSDAEVKKIKELKVAIKKDLITKKAEIDLIAIDIKAAMWEDMVEIDSVNTLIDRKYELKKQKAKSLVAACVALKGMLTKEQIKLLKGLCKKGKKY